MRILSFYLLFLLGSLQAASQQREQRLITAEQNYAMNCPGIVMVQAVFSATVYVNRLEINEGRFDKLVDSVKRLDTTGRLMSPGQKLDIVVKALSRNPLRYFTSGREYFRQAHRVQSTGTGFVVTGDGYVITNCHIIDRDSAFLRNKFIQSTFQEVTEANINALEFSWAMRLNDEQRSLLNEAYGTIYSQVSSMILFDLKKEFFVIYRADSDSGIYSVKKQASVIIKGQAMPGKDVAILKIPDIENLPTVMLSNDTLVRIGTEVFVLGYPEPVNTNTFLASETILEPTLTSGIVSAIKKSIGRWPVIQMDAIITHGSSGSPVVNDKGEVIGLATFGSLDQGGSALASGYNFAIPVSVVNEFIRAVRLEPEQSRATRYFNQGLDHFYQQFYRKARERFEETANLNPHYPQLQFYLEQCRERIEGGADRQTPPRMYVFWVMIVIAVLTSGYLFLKKRREKLIR